MQPNLALRLAAYLIASLLIALPLSELLLSVWPLLYGAPSWRFGAAGHAAEAVLTPLLGLVLLLGLALAEGHRRTLRALSVLSGVVSLVLVASMGLLVLDILELRVRVRFDARPSFDIAALKVLLRLSLTELALLLMSFGGWRASRAPATERPRKARASTAPKPLLVGTAAEGA